jgi:potassium-transporting ATPase potassium-binding subunit
MTANGWLQFLIFIALLLALMRPLGLYMARVLEGERTFLTPLFRPIERLIYRVCGIRSDEEMTWREYTVALLLFSFVSMLLTYLIERVQHFLPWNPQHLAGVAPDLAWNTAASFTTNTNWQSYTPETTMSYFTQMAGLAYHNFLSGAIGIAVAVALVRGIARKESKTIGNFWVDATRATLYILLPICLIFAPILIQQGTAAAPLEQPNQPQTIAQGPVASQEAIKMLGTNGGGFFNANSAHPFENPTPLTNLLEMFAIFLIPAGLTVTLGKMSGSPGHGWAVFACMAALFIAGFVTVYWAESQPNPILHGINQHVSALQSGGNMEGKDVRFGISQSSLFATVTTDASCGAVNSMHDSFTPLGGMVVLANIMLGEVVFGGVGAGLYGILIYVVLAVFIAGLMVGRTPEYLGKKIESYDVKMAMLYVLIFPLAADGFKQPEQQRSAWIERNSLCIHLGRRQQRIGVHGTQRQHALVQPEPRLHHADWPFSHDDSNAGIGRKPGTEEERATISRHISGQHGTFHRALVRRDPHRGRTYVFPSIEPRSDSRAPVAARRATLLAQRRKQWQISKVSGIHLLCARQLLAPLRNSTRA